MNDEHDPEHHHAHGWREALEAMRAETRHYYLDHFDWRGHPPPPGFDGPRYFPPDERWRLDASLDTGARATGEAVTLTTSTGQQRRMTVAGQLVFEVDGGEQRLTAYRSRTDEGSYLFVPFRDATSGGETYGAGRYIDLPDEGDDAEYELDFNLAYNPTCVFSPAYDCPYPPPGNRLDIPVRAGERLPTDA
jgi:uncharacterized protein (DUF1684 family)